jgi:putative transposase
VAKAERIDHWYVAIQTEIKISKESVHSLTKAVGIDVGIKKTISLLDGAFIPPMNAFQSAQQKLGRLKISLRRRRSICRISGPTRLEL